MSCVKETLCTSCVHREVCSKKEAYLAAQTAVDNIQVSVADKTFIDLRLMTWIKPVQLQCVHHMTRSTFFGFADSTSSTAKHSVLDGVFTEVRG